MPLRPIISEFLDAALERRIEALEEKMQRLEAAISVGVGGDISITAPIIHINCPTTQSTGIIQCETIIANSVVGSSYTPGAGNVM